MADPAQPPFLVNAYVDPVVIRIQGKASYLNSAPISRFIRQMIERGKSNIVIDFLNCSSMDSTFLGIIAGAALESRKQDPPGRISLCRLGTRNLELVRNLGLHKICTVDSGDFPMFFDSNNISQETALIPDDEAARSQLEKAKMILRAHENLIEADDANLEKFQDVLAYLKNQMDEEASK